MNLERITIEATPEYSGLDEQSAINYFKAKYSFLPLLKSRVITPFEQLLKKHSGFNNSNIPVEKIFTSTEIGDITFKVDSEKRVKRPRLIEVYEGLRDHLNFLKEGYEEEIQRKGVRTFNNQPYVKLNEVFLRLDELKQEVTVDEIKQSIKHNYNEEFSGNLIVPLSYNLKLTESDALTYVRAESLDKFIKSKTVKPFEDKLKAQTGYDKIHIPKETKTKWVQVGSNLFQLQSIPEKTVKYANIVASLDKEPPKKITAKTKYGELVALRDGLELDKKITEVYNQNNFKNEIYISINGILERINQLKENNTNPSLNQKISYYPAI